MKQSTVIRLLDPSKETFGSIIGSDLEIFGSLLATKSLRIDGTVVGDIKTKAGADVCIALGKTGLVQGNIFGVRVLVAGRVEGNVHASERVELHSGADVHGDIVYAQIGIEHGARLSGKLSKITDKYTSTDNNLENS